MAPMGYRLRLQGLRAASARTTVSGRAIESLRRLRATLAETNLLRAQSDKLNARLRNRLMDLLADRGIPAGNLPGVTARAAPVSTSSALTSSGSTPSGSTSSGSTSSGSTSSGSTSSGSTSSGPTASGPAASGHTTSGAGSMPPQSGPTSAGRRVSMRNQARVDYRGMSSNMPTRGKAIHERRDPNWSSRPSRGKKAKEAAAKAQERAAKKREERALAKLAKASSPSAP